MGRLTVLADEYLINDYDEDDIDRHSSNSSSNNSRKLQLSQQLQLHHQQQQQHPHCRHATNLHYRVVAAADEYRCSPPPLFIISITLLELGFFTYYTVLQSTSLSTSGPLPIDSLFVYRPDRRSELWRFILYMFLHAGWVHLMFNLVIQLLVGLPLEMVHGSTRIAAIYMAGVLAGSLGTSVFDPNVYLVGASGGVYALLAAHLANILLNYKHMEFGLLRLVGVVLIASVDVGFAIYDRYALAGSVVTSSTDEDQPGDVLPSVSYVAHFTGALAGLTIGLLVLKQFEVRLREQLLWWGALSIYGVCMVFAVLFNIFHRTSS